MLTEFKFKQEEQRDQIRNHIANIKSKLSSAVLNLKIGMLKELADQSMTTYEQVQEYVNSTNGPLANITNQTLNSISMSSAKKVSRTDDGTFISILYTHAHERTKAHTNSLFSSSFFFYTLLLVNVSFPFEICLWAFFSVLFTKQLI